MAGNAHARRHGHIADCIYCKQRPKVGNYSNKNGHRHNPGRKRKQKRPVK